MRSHLIIRNCFSIALMIVFSYCGQTQSQQTGKDKAVGGPCDRCDEMYEGMPPLEKISSALTIADKNEPGQSMILHGSVIKKDGQTPAANIVLYIYHTDDKGQYSQSNHQTQGRSHGHLRGWVKTDAAGRFTLKSIRPAPYPGRNIPAHVHILVKEPGKTRYYIDEVWFNDDPFVTKSLRDKSENRGGNMILHLNKNTKGEWESDLKITLGLNVTDYE